MTTVTLAPMEGVVDVYMRDLLTHLGGIDLCVSEFVRVSQNLYPASVFYQYCPELKTGGKTSAGTPVHVQIMGGEPTVMAENAAFVAELGAPGIDINFGCPAKTVNRRDAGATLLQWPDRLHNIVDQVRKAVPAEIPVSAKMRLGFSEKSLALENAQAIAAAGASKLTVHARTKLEGYRAPAHWQYLRPIRDALDIPVVANGEIWTVPDFDKCLEVSGCEHVMIGRGIIARPSLAVEIAAHQTQVEQEVAFEWARILQLVTEYHIGLKDMANETRQAGRLKQWIKLLGRTYQESPELFSHIKRLRDPGEINGILEQELRALPN
ncbi:MAG: tRNA-dihydrouridine synthase [Proteobacteria bacterium]|nr:tRNA-dihydrouridine synthase [Pseudomonadota bacterium]